VIRAAWFASTGLAVLALLLVVANIVISQLNLSARKTLAARQNYNLQSTQLARVDQLVVRTLAEAAQRDANQPLLTLLANNGVTIHIAAPGPPAPTQPKPAAKP
jgi:hypothetical protein